MQYANVAALRLQLTDQRHYTTETAGCAVFDGADPVRVVQVYEGDTGDLLGLLRWLLRCSTARSHDKRADGDEQEIAIHWCALFFVSEDSAERMPVLRLRILRAVTIRA